jgi:hypothetical protein
MGSWMGLWPMPRRTEVLKGKLKGSITYAKEDWSLEGETEGGVLPVPRRIEVLMEGGVLPMPRRTEVLMERGWTEREQELCQGGLKSWWRGAELKGSRNYAQEDWSLDGEGLNWKGAGTMPRRTEVLMERGWTKMEYELCRGEEDWGMPLLKTGPGVDSWSMLRQG